MRVLQAVAPTAIGWLLLPSTAGAHPGPANDLGSMHVLLSFEHVATFLLAGVAVGLLMMFRGTPHWIGAHAILLGFASYEGWFHGSATQTIFGVEVAVFGVVVALLGWFGLNRIIAHRKAPTQEPSV